MPEEQLDYENMNEEENNPQPKQRDNNLVESIKDLRDPKKNNQSSNDIMSSKNSDKRKNSTSKNDNKGISSNNPLSTIKQNVGGKIAQSIPGVAQVQQGVNTVRNIQEKLASQRNGINRDARNEEDKKKKDKEESILRERDQKKENELIDNDSNNNESTEQNIGEEETSSRRSLLRNPFRRNDGKGSFLSNVTGILKMPKPVILTMLFAFIAVFLVILFVTVIVTGIKKFDPEFASDDASTTIGDYGKSGNWITDDTSDSGSSGMSTSEYYADDKLTQEIYDNIKKVSKKYGNNELSVRRMLAALYIVISDYEKDFSESKMTYKKMKQLGRIVNKSIYDQIDSDGADTGVAANNNAETQTALSGESVNATKRIVWVGDSRFVQMYCYDHNWDCKLGEIDKGLTEGNDVWISKGAMSYNWFNTTAVNTINSKIKDGDTIVINMGVNGLNQASSYVDRINKLVGNEWKNVNVVYMSVNPVNENKTIARYGRNTLLKNSKIEAFNKTLQENLDSKVKYIDTYSELLNEVTSDTSKTDSVGVHFNGKEINAKIYNYARNFVEGTNSNASTTSTEYDVEGLSKRLKEYFDKNGQEITDNQAKRYVKEAIQHIEDYKSIIGERNSSSSANCSGDGEKVVEVALKEADPSNPSRVGGQKYWQYLGFGGRVRWCASFVSWVANEAGVSHDVITKSAAVVSHLNHAKATNTYHVNNGTYTPKAGDLIIWKYTCGSRSHIGIVEKTEGDIVHTIEGNSSDQVRRRTYNLKTTCISGFQSPNYADSAVSCDNTPDTITKGTTITLPPGLGTHATREFDLAYTSQQIQHSRNQMRCCRKITNPYAFPESSVQRKVQNLWINAGHVHDSKGFATYKGRMLIAMTSTYGKIGDKVDVYMSNGKVLHCILADAKAQSKAWYDQNPANKWGHSNGKNVLEFIGENRIGNNPYHTLGLDGTTVKKVVNGGSIF